MYLASHRRPVTVLNVCTISVPPSPAEIQASKLTNRDLGPARVPHPSRYAISIRVESAIVENPEGLAENQLPAIEFPFRVRMHKLGDRLLVYQSRIFDPAQDRINWQLVHETLRLQSLVEVEESDLEDAEEFPNIVPLLDAAPKKLSPFIVGWKRDFAVIDAIAMPTSSLELRPLTAVELLDEIQSLRQDFVGSMNPVLSKLQGLDPQQFTDLASEATFPDKIKIGVFGCTNSGKSSLCNCLLKQSFPGNFEYEFVCPTSEAPFTCVVWKIEWGDDAKVIFQREVSRGEDDSKEEVEYETVELPLSAALDENHYGHFLWSMVANARYPDDDVDSKKDRIGPLVRIQIPHPLLKFVTLVDLPGVDEEKVEETVYSEMLTCHTICFVVDASNSAFNIGERAIFGKMKKKFEESQEQRRTSEDQDIVQLMDLKERLVFVGNKIDVSLPSRPAGLPIGLPLPRSSPFHVDRSMLVKKMEEIKATILGVVRDSEIGISLDFPAERVLLTMSHPEKFASGQFSEFYKFLLSKFTSDLLRSYQDLLFLTPAKSLIDSALDKVVAVYDARLGEQKGVFDAAERKIRLEQALGQVRFGLFLLSIGVMMNLKEQFTKLLFSPEGAIRLNLLELLRKVPIEVDKSKIQVEAILLHHVSDFLKDLLKRSLHAVEWRTWKQHNKLLRELGCFRLINLKMGSLRYNSLIPVRKRGLFGRIGFGVSSALTYFDPSDLNWRDSVVSSLMDRSKASFFSSLASGVNEIVKSIVEECQCVVNTELSVVNRMLSEEEEEGEDSKAKMVSYLEQEVELLTLRCKFVKENVPLFKLTTCELLCSPGTLPSGQDGAAEGAFGSVFLQEDAFGTKTALKIFKEDVLMTERMLREIHLLRSFSGRIGFPTFFEAFKIKNRTAILMEGFDSTLEVVLTNESLGGGQRLAIALKIAEALAQMHRLRIFHRDIKPENILIDSDLTRIALADFGISKEESLSVTVGAPGTMFYVDPLTLGGAKKSGIPMDVYSFGVVLMQLWERAGKAYQVLSPVFVAALMGGSPPKIESFLRPVQQVYPDLNQKTHDRVKKMIMMCTIPNWDSRWNMEKIVRKLKKILKTIPSYEEDSGIGVSSVLQQTMTHRLKMEVVKLKFLERLLDSEDSEGNGAPDQQFVEEIQEEGDMDLLLRMLELHGKLLTKNAGGNVGPKDWSGFQRPIPSLTVVREKLDLAVEGIMEILPQCSVPAAIRALFLNEGNVAKAVASVFEKGTDSSPLNYREWMRGTSHFADFEVEECCDDGFCSYSVTRDTYAKHESWSCVTCGIVENRGVCRSCMTKCHAGHRLVEKKPDPKHFCDCGHGQGPSPCSCLREVEMREN